MRRYASRPGQISCGTCTRCGRGLTSDCERVAPLFGPDVPLPLLAMYTMGVHLHTSRCAARPVIPEILRLVAAGRLHPERVTTAVVAWADAATELLTPQTKTVVTR